MRTCEETKDRGLAFEIGEYREKRKIQGSRETRASSAFVATSLGARYIFDSAEGEARM